MRKVKDLLADIYNDIENNVKEIWFEVNDDINNKDYASLDHLI